LKQLLQTEPIQKFQNGIIITFINKQFISYNIFLYQFALPFSESTCFSLPICGLFAPPKKTTWFYTVYKITEIISNYKKSLDDLIHDQLYFDTSV
jgi:hypothetical protein